MNNAKKSRRSRSGVTIVEVLVSAALVCLVASSVGLMNAANSRMIKQVMYKHLAADEASNQITQLMTISVEELGTATGDIRPSAEFLSVFPKATIEAEVDMTNDGTWLSVAVIWGERPEEHVRVSAPVALDIARLRIDGDGDASRGESLPADNQSTIESEASAQ